MEPVTRRGKVQQRILRSAGEVFAARGYQDATIREICRQAEVNLAAVNYYFGDKQRLYIEAVKHARALIAERLPLPEWPSEAPPEQKLELFIGTFLGRLLSSETAAWQTRLLTREMMDPTQACEEIVQESFRPFFEVLLEILRELMSPEVPLHRVHQMGLSVVGQCVFYRAHSQVVTMLIAESERRDFFDVPHLTQHITRTSIAAARRILPAPAAGSSGIR